MNDAKASNFISGKGLSRGAAEACGIDAQRIKIGMTVKIQGQNQSQELEESRQI